MRARVRCFWHVREQKLRLAVLDGEGADAVHFKSFAQLELCCCVQPDLPGVTSRVMRTILGYISPEHPLEIDLAGGGARVVS